MKKKIPNGVYFVINVQADKKLSHLHGYLPNKSINGLEIVDFGCKIFYYASRKHYTTQLAQLWKKSVAGGKRAITDIDFEQDFKCLKFLLFFFF